MAAKKQRDSYEKKIHSLQQKNQILGTKAARSDLESDTIRHNMQLEQKNLQKRLNEVERQKDELEYMLKMKNPGQVPSSYWSIFEQEQKNMAELSTISKHLDTLDNYQRKQLSSFEGKRKCVFSV